MVKLRLMVCRAIGVATALYATVAAGAEPVAAQETGYRVVLEARYRAALVVPEIVCRDAPSQSADAAGQLTVGGDGWASEFLVGRTERDGAGERWIHIGPGLTGRYGIPDGCWVPESVVAPTEKAGHLLQLADGLLSAAAWPPLEHFVAAHNLFVHPRYRERVQESAVLGQRRLDLLAKAVEAAQSEQWGVPRPVDRNPLVLAWLEALGEQVRYSEDRWGRGTWTVSEDTVRADRGPAGPPQPEPTTPNEGRELAVIAPDVVCRPRPSRTAFGSIVLPVDFHFRTGRADTSVAGETWVHVRPYGCWVPSGYTAPGDSEGHVLAIADRFLTSGEAWSADNLLRLHTVLSSWNRGHREEVEASAILGLRRLQALRGALAHSAARGPMSADALTRAWIGALGGEVALTAEGHAWTVSDEAYLTLYEKHRADPFAEEIMWTYASESDAYSCEGYFDCYVEQAVNRRLARYWVDFPDGRHIAEAVEDGRAVLAYGLETCNAARGAEPDSPEARGWRGSGWERSAEIVRELMETLNAVSEEDRAPLVDALRELEACAPAAGPGGGGRAVA